MTKLHPEIKAQWVAALRSGEYKQGQGGLQSITADGVATHCCLGVLCDIAVKAGVKVDVETRRHNKGFDDDPDLAAAYVAYDGLTGLPPDSVLDWAGGETWNVRTELKSPLVDGSWPLAVLNDGRIFMTASRRDNVPKHTFLEIADIIEEQL